MLSDFNVFPNEIEAIAARCASVSECACVGILNDKMGEALKLFVVRAPGAIFMTDQLIAHCPSPPSKNSCVANCAMPT